MHWSRYEKVLRRSKSRPKGRLGSTLVDCGFKRDPEEAINVKDSQGINVKRQAWSAERIQWQRKCIWSLRGRGWGGWPAARPLDEALDKCSFHVVDVAFFPTGQRGQLIWKPWHWRFPSRPAAMGRLLRRLPIPLFQVGVHAPAPRLARLNGPLGAQP